MGDRYILIYLGAIIYSQTNLQNQLIAVKKGITSAHPNASQSFFVVYLETHKKQLKKQLKELQVRRMKKAITTNLILKIILQERDNHRTIKLGQNSTAKTRNISKHDFHINYLNIKTKYQINKKKVGK